MEVVLRETQSKPPARAALGPVSGGAKSLRPQPLPPIQMNHGLLGSRGWNASLIRGIRAIRGQDPLPRALGAQVRDLPLARADALPQTRLSGAQPRVSEAQPQVSEPQTHVCAVQTRVEAAQTRVCAARTIVCSAQTQGCAVKTRGCAMQTRGCAEPTMDSETSPIARNAQPAMALHTPGVPCAWCGWIGLPGSLAPWRFLLLSTERV